MPVQPLPESTFPQQPPPLRIAIPFHIYIEHMSEKMEIQEVAQPQELRGNLDKVILLLLHEGSQVNGREAESLQIIHLSQERSKRGQHGQMPGPIPTHLDTVQLHHAQDLHSAVHGHRDSLQLLAAQVDGGFTLLQPPEDVGEEVVQGPFLQAKIYKNLQWSQVLLFG